MVKNAEPKKRQFECWSTFIAVVVVLVVLALLAPGMSGPHPPPRDRLVSMLELEMLANATAAFENNYGHKPPNASMESVLKHLHALDQKIDAVDVDAIAKLDDAERLLFWLGGGFPNVEHGFEREVFVDFDYGRFVDRDDDGFPEYLSKLGQVFEYDSAADRVSCDFSDDKLTVDINR